MPEEPVDLAKLSGMLREAAQGKGNFSLGVTTAAEAAAIGRAWVGEGYTVASNGQTLVSLNRLRQYRPPAISHTWGNTRRILSKDSQDKLNGTLTPISI
jgi:filamentous hemagglutinin